MQTVPAYRLTSEQLFRQLQSDEHGLSEGEAAHRLEHYGPNQLTAKKKVSPLSLYLEQFKNTLTLILIGAAFVILFIYFFGGKDPSDLVEAGLILTIVAMITVLGFFQEYKAEKAIESLKKMLAYNAKVRRGGKEAIVPVSNLVPGDIILLEEGVKVPADIRLLEVVSLQVNEASLTGESTSVSKQIETLTDDKQLADQKNMLFAGTAITSGRGVGIVVTTGDGTEIGKIAKDVANTQDAPTPIQKRLDQIGKSLGYIILVVCAVVFVFIMFFAKDFTHLSLLQRLIQSFIASVALAVAAIPEGLPAVVTISLALGTQRMLRKNALVRKLNSVETLGSTDVICSDKTGTLTRGEMTVRKIFMRSETYEVTGVGYETAGEFHQNNKKVDAALLTKLLEVGLACNNAALSAEGKVKGDPTEAALLVSAKKAGLADPSGKRILEIPFSSERKRMTVVVKQKEGYVVYAKGAPEVLIQYCNVSDKEKKHILAATHDFSTQALRNLGFATKVLSEKEFLAQKSKPAKLESGLTFVGIQGMIDPPRLEVKPLIAACQQSGIQVTMITGDHIETARAVAHEIGIVGDALTGDALDNMSDAAFARAVTDIHIYARVNPNTKMRIVEALQKKGHIVAMTGDGVNDAPALKKADIGIAMGITGTDVAKEASDMVLLDDKFSTIIAAIEEGRGIFHNIRKFVVYLLSCNIAEVFVVFFGVVVLQELVLTATILLWINVVTDGLPAIALGLDRAEKGILKYPPKVFQSALINKRLWIEMFISGALLAGMVLLVYLLTKSSGLAVAQGAAFAAIVVFEFVNLYIIRSNYAIPFFSNKWLFVSIMVTLLLQVIIIYQPVISGIFAIHVFAPILWVFILVASVWLWISYRLIGQVLVRLE